MNQRIRGLDGLRALSIILVIIAHIGYMGYDFKGSARLDLGPTGVSIFFVISGFLITILLLREKDAGAISLKDFYTRRAFRILPAYLTFLFLVTALNSKGLILLNPFDSLRALTFSSNYVLPKWSLGHTWSLSVEEQFYLIWPLLLIFVRMRYLVAGIVFAYIFTPVMLTLQQKYGIWPNPWSAFEFNAGKLGCGCLAAMLLHNRRQWVLNSANCFMLLALCLGALSLVLRPDYLFFAKAMIPAMAACGILFLVGKPESWLITVLEWKPLAWLGTLSYSLYLWQQIFFDKDNHMPWWAIAILLPAATLISYYWIEQPMIRFGRTWHTSKKQPIQSNAPVLE